MSIVIGIEARSVSHPQLGGYKTYTANLLEALVQLASNHRFYLYTDRHTPIELNGLSTAHRVRVVPVTNRLPVIRQVVREQLQLARKSTADGLQVMHYTANTGAIRTSCPFVLTLHDIIALSMPQARLGSATARLWQWLIAQYDRRVIPTMARRSSAIITVSEYEKLQIINTLGIDDSKVYAIPLAPARVFRPLSAGELWDAQAWLKTEFDLDPGFVLTIGYEPRKNIKVVIDAYYRLSATLRSSHDLVVVCARHAFRETYIDYAAQFPGPGNVKVVGGFAPESLNRLYNVASVFVFPSQRESFGLPPLEALACGRPVITSDTTSLPEVVGDAALLVPPNDVEAISAATARVLSDAAVARDLTAKGLERSATYSWRETARRTLEVYEQVASHR